MARSTCGRAAPRGEKRSSSHRQRNAHHFAAFPCSLRCRFLAAVRPFLKAASVSLPRQVGREVGGAGARAAGPRRRGVRADLRDQGLLVSARTQLQWPRPAAAGIAAGCAYSCRTLGCLQLPNTCSPQHGRHAGGGGVGRDGLHGRDGQAVGRCVHALGGGPSRRWRDDVICADAPSPSVLKHLLKVEGGAAA